MKKILSLTLVLAMVMSMGITTVFAAGNWEGGTQVTYTATGAEEWTVTVPATLTPGNGGDVTAAGTWGSNRKLVVSADENVVLENSINSADTKTLAVTFPGIALKGSNTAAVTDTKVVSVAAMPADALFGTWSGTFYYDVEMVDVAVAVPGATFSGYLVNPGCHDISLGNPHELGCYTAQETTLTWEQLKLEENGAKYGYNASVINDTTIGIDAFKCTTALKSITLPEGITTIDTSAFSGLEYLESVTLPDSVTSIGRFAFIGCSSLGSINFEGTIAQWNAISKGDDWSDYVTVTEIICSDGTVANPAPWE